MGIEDLMVSSSHFPFSRKSSKMFLTKPFHMTSPHPQYSGTGSACSKLKKWLGQKHLARFAREYRETYIGTSKEQRTTTGHKEEVTKARLPLDKMGSPHPQYSGTGSACSKLKKWLGQKHLARFARERKMGKADVVKALSVNFACKDRLSREPMGRCGAPEQST
jgi:hypothetical protein